MKYAAVSTTAARATTVNKLMIAVSCEMTLSPRLTIHLRAKCQQVEPLDANRRSPIIPAIEAAVFGGPTRFAFQKGVGVAIEQVIIVGSGPAGWSAAIYAARAELRPLLFEGAITEENRLKGTLPLGQLALTTEVENYAGFPAGVLQQFLETAIAPERLKYVLIHEGRHAVTGPELMELMRQQALNFGTRIVTDDVVAVDLQRRPFVVRTLGGATHETHALIIATGAPGKLPRIAFGRSLQEPRRECLRRM